MTKVLLVEDEPKITELVSNYLASEGYTVLVAPDGAAGLRFFHQEAPDIVLLDIMLPKLSGIDVCKEIRRHHNTPIIMLTARSEEVDKLLGLEIGADDYITKPFSLRELVARMRAVLRRVQRNPENEMLVFDRLELNTEKYHLEIDGKIVPLTPTEFRLMEMFMRNPGRVFTRSQLLEGALGESFVGYERSIDTHIRNLRRKLEKEVACGYISTVFGVGYKLVRPHKQEMSNEKPQR